jgi:demethylmenaquinone methyltransferase/2-methoxy-6-polyprenyl-1,4-benzoquinol methylase
MAAGYDGHLAPLRRLDDRLRRLTVQQLRLRGGATVLDVGCGTGASFPFLVAAVGPAGRIVGVRPE